MGCDHWSENRVTEHTTSFAREDVQAIPFERGKCTIIVVEHESLKSAVASHQGTFECSYCRTHPIRGGWLSEYAEESKSIIRIARNSGGRVFNAYPHFATPPKRTEGLLLERTETAVPHEVRPKTNVKERRGVTQPWFPTV